MTNEFHIYIATTSHSIADTRIFHKQAISLHRAGYRVTLIGQEIDGEFDFPFKTIPLKRSTHKFKRYFINVLQVFFHGLRANADIYHFHDPELLIVALAFRFFGKKVIFDSHENYSLNLKAHDLPINIERFLDSCWRILANFVGKALSHVIAADSNIKACYYAPKTTVIGNYPSKRMFDFAVSNPKGEVRSLRIIYSGALSEVRGIGKLISALSMIDKLPIELHLAGQCSSSALRESILSSTKVTLHNYLNWNDLVKLYKQCDVGMALYQPIPTYTMSTGEGTLKIYEYMGISLPIVISDFPNLKRIIEDADCGIAVDPTSPEKIAGVIEYLYNNPEIRKRMGDNGNRAFLEKYNWESEERKLIDLYAQLLSS